MSTDAKAASELRSRSSFSSRDNAQAGGGEEDNVNQKKGWLRSRVSRFSTFGKRKSCIITGILLLILATISVLVVSVEEIRLVSIIYWSTKCVHMLYLYCFIHYWVERSGGQLISYVDMIMVLVGIMCFFWSDIIMYENHNLQRRLSIWIRKHTTYPYNNKQKSNYMWYRKKREKAVLVLCVNACLKHVCFNSLV